MENCLVNQNPRQDKKRYTEHVEKNNKYTVCVCNLKMYLHMFIKRISFAVFDRIYT